MFKMRSMTYMFGLIGISVTISSFAIIAMLVMEYKKRKLNRFLQGKRLFMEKARRNKSMQFIKLALAHLLVFATSDILFNTSIIFSCYVGTGGFAFEIIGLILETSAGFFNAIIHLKMKQPQSEAENSELLTRHSLRKSSVESVILISGGFKPKMRNLLVEPTVINNLSNNITDFGIFIGEEEDDDDVEAGH